MDPPRVDRQPPDQPIEEGIDKLDVGCCRLKSLAAAVAAVPRQNPLPAAGPRRINDDCCPRRGEVVQPREPAHLTGVALAAMEGEHDRPAGGRRGTVRYTAHGRAPPTGDIDGDLDIDRGGSVIGSGRHRGASWGGTGAERGQTIGRR